MTAPAGGARPGAGRPRLGAEVQAVRLNIRIPRELADWLDRQRVGSTGRSGVVRAILQVAKDWDDSAKKISKTLEQQIESK